MSRLATPAAPTEAAVALNPAQRAAVEHDPQASGLLVIAGAGAGKTATLAARVAWLLRHGSDPQRVLLLTFSRRAAAEMTRRVGRLLAAERALPPHVPAPRLPWCGTFHAVAAALLRAEAHTPEAAEGFLHAAAELAPRLAGAEALMASVMVYPPVPMAVARVANVERMQMLVESSSRGALQRLLALWLPALHQLRRERSGAGQRILRWAVDVDPLAI